jgi:hypothetical protein
MNTFFTDDFSLMHLFHCIYFLSLFHANTPNFPKTSLTNNINAIEMLLCNLFIFFFFFRRILKFRQINFKAIFYILLGFLWNCGVTSIMLFIFSSWNLLTFSCAVLYLCSARHDYSCTIHTCFSEFWQKYRRWLMIGCWLFIGIFIG